MKGIKGLKYKSLSHVKVSVIRKHNMNVIKSNKMTENMSNCPYKQIKNNDCVLLLDHVQNKVYFAEFLSSLSMFAVTHNASVMPLTKL